MRIKKKFQRGTARVFISRKKAMKKLQLSLKDFRKLCIIKGIYPREPNHVKKANKGGTQNRIFYHLRDISFLAQEPLIQKFRDYKILLRKVSHARAKKEELKANTLLQSKPLISYDHIVKERCPTFSSALHELDDALCLCFAYASLTRSNVAQAMLINRCKRLVTEFMHYIIEAKALKKVFISIKGIYYQAEILGEKITWICGHERSVGRSNELDLTTMTYFAEFYTCLLHFVNYRLFKSIGLFYPPQLRQHSGLCENDYSFKGTQDLDGRIYSLAFPIRKMEKAEPEIIIDSFSEDQQEDNLIERMRQNEALKTLFSKFKIFLNREVPKESLSFVIRSGGGFVCWEGCSPNAVTESSESITHQIVDRNMQKMDINRVYVQPQWVFDSFNARRLLSTMKYAPSATLPPHLSPFVEGQTEGEYNPADRIVEQLNEEEKGSAGQLGGIDKQKKRKENNDQKGMRVEKARVYKESQQKKINQEGHKLKLNEMMLPKKHKRVYEKIKRGMKNKTKTANKLKEKRAKLDMAAMEETG